MTKPINIIPFHDQEDFLRNTLTYMILYLLAIIEYT